MSWIGNLKSEKLVAEHVSYFYNYIMRDIYECEFKLVARQKNG